jgi:Protein of unknown function (DUF3014)
MPGLDDVDIDPATTPPGGGPRDGRRSPWPSAGWMLVVLVLAVAGYYVAQHFHKPAVPAAEPGAPTPPATQEAPPAPAGEAPGPLPTLDASDALVRELARALSANPDVAAWLATDGVIRRVVVVVDNVAEGVNPAKQVPFLTPAGSFEVSQEAAGTVVAPSSFHRYDRLGSAVASLDVDGLARLERRLEPLLDQAYRDLGYPNGRFRDALALAITSLLATPVPDAPIEVEPGLRSYRFRAPSLEALTPAQKQLVRMGADNERQVQAKLRELGTALDLKVQ